MDFGGVKCFVFPVWIGPVFSLGNMTSNVSVSCNVNNGGCEQICVRGNGSADHCSCFSNGFTMTPSGLKCLGQ